MEQVRHHGGERRRARGVADGVRARDGARGRHDTTDSSGAGVQKFPRPSAESAGASSAARDASAASPMRRSPRGLLRRVRRLSIHSARKVAS